MGKFPGTVSLRLCGAQAECRERVGGWLGGLGGVAKRVTKRKKQKMRKREEREKREQEIERGRDKKRRDTVPPGASCELS